MKKHINLFLILFFYSSVIIAQSEYWQTSYGVTPGVSNAVNASLFEKDYTFVAIAGRFLYEDSYFLELDQTIQMPQTGSPLGAHYFYGTEVENNGTPFYFAAQRTRDDENNIYLNTFTPEAIFVEGFELETTFGDNSTKGPAVVQVNDSEMKIFANESFYSVGLASGGAINLESTKPATYGLIADAKAYNDGYILCNESGKLVYVNQDLEEVWVEDLGSPLRAVLILSDGFMLAAEVDGESALMKTDFNGGLVWEKKYGAGYATDLDFSNEDGFVFTGKSDSAYVIKTDVDGNVKWDKTYTAGTGSNILKSKFGGYLLQVRFNVSTFIFRITEDGSTGPLIDGPQAKAIEANNIRTTGASRGQLFWDGLNLSDINTTFPKDSSTVTLFAGGLWFSAVDQDGFLHSAITNYTLTDFTPGPFESEFQDYENWENVWRINKKQINRFREDFEDGALDEAYPFDLWTYPGAGNPNFTLLGGEGEVPQNMAPFVDVNNDGIYNILDGDYPDIKGDDMIWWVMSNKVVGTSVAGEPMEIEVQASLYAYECDESMVLYNAAFLDLKVINYSDNNYSDLHVGTLIDFDIGCYFDDYIGSLPATNSVFSYNDSSVDGIDDCNGYPSFEQGKIPIQSVTYLNTDMNYSMHFNNPSFGELVTNPPENALELHNFLQTTWTDGSPQTEGGNGHGGVTPVNYAFPGNPADTDAWSMCTAGALFPNDRRIFMINGPETMAPGQIKRLDIGLLVHENIDYPCPDMSQVQTEIEMLQNFYDNGGLEYDLYLGPDQGFEDGDTIVLEAGEGAEAYSWSTGETTASIEVTAPGLYDVTVTTVSGCIYVDEINIGGAVSLSEVQKQAPKIYPNPASQQLFIELTEEVPRYVTLENTLGQRLQEHRIAAGSQYSTLELNIAGLSKGLYLVRFHYGAGEKDLIRKLVVAE